MKAQPLTHGVHTVDDALQWARWSRTKSGQPADPYQFQQAVIAARLLQAECESLRAQLDAASYVAEHAE